jgi:hypothetical protein
LSVVVMVRVLPLVAVVGVPLVTDRFVLAVSGRAATAKTAVGTRATGAAFRAVRTTFLTDLLVFDFIFIGG